MFRRTALALAAIGAFWAHGALKLDGDFNRQVISVGLKASIPDLRVVDDGGTPLDPSAYTVVYSGNDAYGQATVTVTVNEGADAGTVLTKTFDVVPVPVAYQPLKWVDLDSWQYIRTSIVPNNNMDIDIRLANLDQSGGKDGGQAICCQYWNWLDGYLFAFNGNCGNPSRNRNHFYVNDNTKTTSQYGYSVLGDWAAGREYHINLNHETQKGTLDDSDGHHIEVKYTPGAGGNRMLNLFCDQDGDSRLTCRLYHFTFFENGLPLLDLVPVRRLSDNKVGLLDAAHPDGAASFYASDSGVDFLPGPGNGFVVEPIADQPFTGSAVMPAMIVRLPDGTVVDPANYEATYENNVALGTATAIIIGKGDYQMFSGSVSFQIVPPVDETRITLDGDFGTRDTSLGVPVKIDDLTVLGADGQPLAEGTYEVGYMNNAANGLATVWARITAGRDAGAVNCRGFEVAAVPAGYRFIDWIESSGTQWIDTRVISSKTLVTACVITPNEVTCAKGTGGAAVQHAIFGSGWSSDQYGLLTSDAKWRPTSGGKYTDSVSDITLGKRTTLVYTTAGLQIDAERLSLSELSGYDINKNKYGNVLIFDTPTKATSTDQYRGQYKLNSFKMTNDGVVLRDLVPVLNPEGKPGLFDLAHIEDGDSAFYSNGNADGDDFGHPPVPKATFSVPPIPTQAMAGENPMPITKVIDAETGEALDLNDFIVVYGDNDKPGTARFSVWGKEGTSYAGQSVSGRFKIARVIFVTAYSLATEGTGYSWDSPVSFTRALNIAAILTEDVEIWVKSGTWALPEAKEFLISRSVVIRGGFAGTEKTPDERLAGLFTTLDGHGAYTCLTCDNSASLTIDRLRLTRGLEHGFLKSGAGDLTLANCEIVNCGLTTAQNSSGLAMSLSGNANVFVTNCLIAGCVDTSDVVGTGHHGAVAIAQGMKRVYMDDCRFLTNGVPFNVTGRTTLDGRGAAIWADSPVTLRRCEFRGNKGLDCGYGCGVVYLYRNSGGSALTNCLFVGNNGLKCKYGATGDGPNIARGCLVVYPQAGDRTEVVNCTFAYNLVAGMVNETTGNTGAAGINVVAGDTVVKNCIFYGNAVHTTFPATQTIDMTCHNPSPTASLTVSYTLAHDLYPGEGNKTGDPRFVSTTSDFFKLVNTDHPSLPKMDMDIRTGFQFKPEKLAEVLALDVHVRGRSPAIDAGDPSDDYRKEPKPNGRRVNLGAYGNTPEATHSASGTILILR